MRPDYTPSHTDSAISELRLDLRTIALREILLDGHLRFVDNTGILDCRRHIHVFVEISFHRVF